jgi:hypothetical protein
MSKDILLSPSFNEDGIAPGRYFDSPIGYGEITMDTRLKTLWISFESGIHGWKEAPGNESKKGLQENISEDSILKEIIRKEIVFQQARPQT